MRVNPIRFEWTIKPFLLFVLIGSWSCTANEHSSQKGTALPNILVILTDDQGYPTLGSYGGNIVQTPHLDQLASEGVLFTDAYVTSQCTPTRASFLTGQYTTSHKMWHVIGWYGYPWATMAESAFREQFPRASFTVAKGLQKAGYKTGIFGKWHLTTNQDGHYRGLQSSAAPHYGFDFAPEVLGDEHFKKGADRGIQLLTQQSLDFINKQQESPWFCFLSHHMIHGKVVAPDSLVAKYEQQGYGSEGPNRALYLAGLELIDWSVGRIVEGLKEIGEYNNTVIVFVSDNGGIDRRHEIKNLSYSAPEGFEFAANLKEYENDPLRGGKGSIYEGGVRVPMIIRWPGHGIENRQISTPVHIIDLAPTFMEIAGAASQGHLEGESLVNLLNGADTKYLAQRPIYQYYPFYDLLWGLTPCASIRIGDYKLIEFFGDRVDARHTYRMGKHIELYNLSEDIGETTNLAEKEKERSQELLDKLHQWFLDIDVNPPTKNPHYKPEKAFENTREKPDWLLMQ
ncbi:MAG: sulfatase [Saprospiraceae bacterium]|nr:sulfatase [Saprospiraceae bacterium]